ncbi:hypothetical protein RHMOL_Rhmol02G0261900 [Rhododendron molle]|uniref:Uncharacterized protein n=1 Tax=Rhododendron molle TaxID=49168 RepID=A0ACC0PXG4_RHOML|nr:hypothetical protein RHMOL_Rhmol02G0261900 [Rhododendron molle]
MPRSRDRRENLRPTSPLPPPHLAVRTTGNCQDSNLPSKQRQKGGTTWRRRRQRRTRARQRYKERERGGKKKEGEGEIERDQRREKRGNEIRTPPVPPSHWVRNPRREGGEGRGRTKRKRLRLCIIMAALPRDDLTRSSSSRRSFVSGSRESCASVSFPEAGKGQPDVLGRVMSRSERQDDEEKLRWAAIERLPTYDRLRKGILNRVLDDGKIMQSEVDVTKLGNQEKKLLMDSVLKTTEDNERFLQRLKDRTDR